MSGLVPADRPRLTPPIHRKHVGITVQARLMIRLSSSLGDLLPYCFWPPGAKMPDAADTRCNALLAALSTVAHTRLSPHLELVRLSRDQRIHDPHVPQRHVYFPIDCIVSLQTVLSDGSSDEIAIV